jgi:hypothetical protein
VQWSSGRRQALLKGRDPVLRWITWELEQ